MRSSAMDLPGALADEAVGGEVVGVGGKPVSTFGEGRVCEEEGCETRLSTYNSRSRCAAHDFDPTLMNFRCPTGSTRTTGPHARSVQATVTHVRRVKVTAASRRRRAA